MQPTRIVAHHNDKFYRVMIDSETGLIIDPVNMYRKETEISKEEAIEFYGYKEDF